MEHTDGAIQRCSCGSANHVLVYAAKLFEQNDQIVVVKGVPHLDCQDCGEQFVLEQIVEQLDFQVIDLLASGASLVVADWLGS